MSVLEPVGAPAFTGVPSSEACWGGLMRGEERLSAPEKPLSSSCASALARIRLRNGLGRRARLQAVPKTSQTRCGFSR
jgi:hypothetical protein